MKLASLRSAFAGTTVVLCLCAGCGTPAGKTTNALQRDSSRLCTARSCSSAVAEATRAGREANLAVPASGPERTYLGLPEGAAFFALSDVRADVLIVDLFDMYCHVCQKTAPKVNALYLLLHTKGYGNRIKMIGIAVGDTPLEADTFRKKLHVPFPVFPDPPKAVSTQLGFVKRPTLLALKKKDGRLTVIFSHTGSIDDVEETLGEILRASGM